MKMRQVKLWSVIACSIFAVLSVASARATPLSDWSFENGIDPLPSLGAVVGPPFSSGFWGAERGGEVTAERGVTPFHLQHMLYMEDEGGVVTQAFQAVDVSSFATLIDSGGAVADLSAWVNTYLSGQIFWPALFYFDGPNGWGSPINSTNWLYDVDPNAETWQLISATDPIPVGTRWIVVQVGYRNAELPDNERAYVDAVEFNIIPEPATLTLLAAGLMAGLRRRR
ncbi:MAG: hypothetical protein HBSAPP02_30780 [Phycisphaerae bacterium]|nr:MAG: hypothetical protein HBSAPP02_30780 [Phycisphaerae bacterium]